MCIRNAPPPLAPSLSVPPSVDYVYIHSHMHTLMQSYIYKSCSASACPIAFRPPFFRLSLHPRSNTYTCVNMYIHNALPPLAHPSLSVPLSVNYLYVHAQYIHRDKHIDAECTASACPIAFCTPFCRTSLRTHSNTYTFINMYIHNALPPHAPSRFIPSSVDYLYIYTHIYMHLYYQIHVHSTPPPRLPDLVFRYVHVRGHIYTMHRTYT